MHSQQSSQQQQYQNIKPKDILEELERLRQQIIQNQKIALSQVLNLQKFLNRLQSTNIVRQKIQNQIKKQQKQQKKQFNIERVAQKIQQIIDDTPQINLNNPVKVIKKQIAKQIVKPQIIVQKKPPIPSSNRLNDPTKISTIPRYIPPRNKNEVTGKVTQNKIITQQKVFKPQATKNSSNLSLSTTKTQMNTISRGMSSKKNIPASSSKQINNSIANNNNTNNVGNKFLQSKQSLNIDNDQNAVAEYKDLRTKQQINKLKSFSKSIDQLISEAQSKKQSGKRKNFKQLIEKYLNQQMGHRAIEQKKKKLFIQHYNNYCFSKNSTIPDITASAPKRSWNQYQNIFQFNDLIQNFQSDISKLQEQVKQDLRIDPKQVCRVQIKRQLIGKQIQKILQSTQVQVPERLDLTFNVKKKSIDQQINNISNQSVNINFTPLYSKLSSLLDSIQSQQSLSTAQLSLLRVLSQISIYNARRSPLIVQANSFQQWRDYYEDIDGNQIS